ncbi:MAG: CapA family protein [Bacteroidales bacterium]|nr:CapA family protein [Bacteroidales bacterium]
MISKIRKALLFAVIIISIPLQGNGSGQQDMTLLFIGDIMGHDTQINSAYNRDSDTYDYNDVFSYISPVISEADIAIANLEVTLAGPPYKGYPQFSSPSALAQACKNAGIDCLVTANNHSADRGNKGIVQTIGNLDSIGLPHTGTFTGQEDKKKNHPLTLSSKGISLALLNYTYGTNGIAVNPPAIVNMLNRESIAEDIASADAAGHDLVVLFLHWGTEYDTIPSAEQVEMAEYFFSAGADLIIGSHPHVLQKMMWYRDGSDSSGGAVVYSLGNFVSNQRKPKTDGGSMVKISLRKENGKIKITEGGFYLTWVYTPVLGSKLNFFILPCSVFENRPSFFEKESDFLQMKRFIDESRLLLTNQNVNFKEYVYDGSRWLLNN